MIDKKYAPIILRIGISLVFLWFGSQQILHASDWVTWLPSFINSLPMQPTTFVLFNGTFEVILGVLLILGIFTRVAAALLAIHLLGIAFSIGYNDVAIRDFGLFMACVAIFFYGPDDWCLKK
ncbi:DoxX family protein [Candidatus Pacearchaeota archaeon]|nr:DoxX family protein [Candidatus Pacearchaeota archaeon]